VIDEIIQELENKVNIAKGKHYVISNLSNEVINGDMRGWICGHFYPKGSAFHRNDVEICFKTVHKGHTEERHHHLCSFEFLVVLSGEVEYEIDGDNHVLKPGMFYMLEPGNTERIVEVYKETTVLAVRLPSIPGNKVFENVRAEEARID
jgi:mannose-6-phosphate isomerase-like protein (cupin superfamily)